MNRKLCSVVPLTPTQLQPAVPDYSIEENREKQKRNFDLQHRTRDRISLSPGERVWVADQQTSQ